MISVGLFFEDAAQGLFIEPLAVRIAFEQEVRVALRSITMRRGYPGVCRAVRQYGRELRLHTTERFDVIVAAIDANCLGFRQRRDDFLRRLPPEIPVSHLVLAIPDPHIERWYMADPAAFKEVFGRGCTLPKKKCAKDYYKELLCNGIAALGVTAPLGGAEYGQELVRAMDFEYVRKHEPSFAKFSSDLTKALRTAA